MEDISRGNSPAPDIGIHLDIPDEAEPPPRITAFEGKQLSTNLSKIRRREYVIGHKEGGKHVKCGGIERFKIGIHGGKLYHAGMIGYIQNETPAHWRDKINSWISELSLEQHDPAWSELEHLMALTNEGRVTACSSLVCRQTDQLHLTHLWINLGI